MKKLFVSFGLMAALAVSVLIHTPAQAQSTARDCDANAIINCGALSASELKEKYTKNESKDLPAVFNHYGISSADVNAISNAKEGRVYKDGRVVVDGKTVATGAKSVGRQNIAGSSKITIGGKTFYERATSVSFKNDWLPAFVALKSDGTFDYAIIKSCGNPVVATPEKPAPKPVYACTSLRADKINRTTYKFIAAGNASNGASITSYSFGFGDGKGITVKDSSYTYTYTKAGTYTASVTINVSAAGKNQTATSTKCQVKVQVVEEQKKPEPCPYNPNLEKGHPDCKKKEEPKECKPGIPEGDERCEDTPQVLPATGPEQFIGAGVGLGSLTAAGYYWMNSRRTLMSSFSNRK